MYNVSASPHVKSGVTTANLMRDVVIALIPASAFGIYQFGFSAFLILMVSVATCVLSEYAYAKMIKKPYKPYECSAIVTGLLLGMNLPSTVPVWIPILGGVFAIIVVKEIYGGLGQNFMNPALAARCFLLISFAGRMTNFKMNPVSEYSGKSQGLYLFNNGAAAVDGLSSATPLAALKAGESVSITDMLFGFTGGVIGETSAILLLIGGLYLVVRKVISLRIPLTYIGSLAVFVLIFGGKGFDMNFVLAHIFGGGLILGAFFMATDYVTSPITKMGQLAYGVFLGILTGIFRIYGGSAEGVSYAIIFGNLVVPLIEKWTMPRAFGIGGKKYAK